MICLELFSAVCSSQFLSKQQMKVRKKNKKDSHQPKMILAHLGGSKSSLEGGETWSDTSPTSWGTDTISSEGNCGPTRWLVPTTSDDDVDGSTKMVTVFPLSVQKKKKKKKKKSTLR
eukprot:Trichotokara_eunicae@DN4688_c0_g1_i1.p2